MDALDIDISNAIIENCHFENSGNDAIDLMMANAVIINTVIKDSVDKGLSVGEESILLSFNNQLIKNKIAVQVKDDSIAVLYNMELMDNEHALDAYRKNWRYENGGTIYFQNGDISKNAKIATADKKSHILIANSNFDQIIKTTNRVQVSENRLPKNYPDIVNSLPEFAQNYLQFIKHDIKGTVNLD